MSKVNLASLNKVLPCNTANKSTDRRNVSKNHKNDAVATELAKCNNAEDVGNFAMKLGISEQEVRTRAKAAKNFGLYRMVIGNRARGIAKKMVAAKNAGVKLTFADAAYPPKAVKKVAKKVTKKTTKKTKKTTKK